MAVFSSFFENMINFTNERNPFIYLILYKYTAKEI